MSEELYNCETHRETQNAMSVIQVHVFADRYQAEGEAKRYRAQGGRCRIMSRDIKVAGCRVRVYCLIRVAGLPVAA